MCKLQGNFKIYFKEIDWDGTDWIRLVVYNKRRDLHKRGINFFDIYIYKGKGKGKGKGVPITGHEGPEGE